MPDFKRDRTPTEDAYLTHVNIILTRALGDIGKEMVKLGTSPEKAMTELTKESVAVAATMRFGIAYASGKPADRDLFLLSCAQMFDEAAEANVRIKAKMKRAV